MLRICLYKINLVDTSVCVCVCPLTVLSSGDMDGHWWDHASWHSEASSMSMVRLVTLSPHFPSFNSPLHVLFLLLFYIIHNF